MTAPQPRPPALTTEPLTDANEALWEAFVEGAPDATFFHRAGWRRVIRNAYRYECHHRLVRQDGRVTGVLPLLHVRSRLFGDALISMAFCVQGGIAAETPEAAAALGAEHEAGQDQAVDVGAAARVGPHHHKRREAARARDAQLDGAELGHQPAPVAAVAPVGLLAQRHLLEVAIDALGHPALQDILERDAGGLPVVLAPFDPLRLHCLHHPERAR